MHAAVPKPWPGPLPIRPAFATLERPMPALDPPRVALVLLLAAAGAGCERQQSLAQKAPPPPPQVSVAKPVRKIVANTDE